ncbi:MAG: hypothetical protein JW981_05440, partial [Anaerolineae bacterium]|nr:hypothetical protein [Anaerolineae bacterium]
MNTLNRHSDMPILTTKFYIPLSLPDLVSRPHLIQRLNATLLRRPRMTLVAAPAGFGKTTLIATWLRILMKTPEAWPVGTAGLKCAWLSLEGDDNNPTRFFTYFVATIENTLGSVGDDIHSLLKSPSQRKAMLTILINNLATISWELVIILDDYHLIADTTIHEALSFFIDHLPPQVHLVIISRMDPPLSLARLRTRGQLTELRAADLRFTPEETAAFFQDVMGLVLSMEDIAALEARTEGWIAGLQLAALSLRGRLSDNITNFITDFSGSNRHIIDYLADEVLHQLDPDVYSFLCQTAILDYLTASLCDVLTGRDDSQELLRYLEQANLFVVPLDQQRKWYRYHHLFADFLRNNLRQDMPEQVIGLHHRAAHWYEQQGMLGLAVNHILATEDFEAATLLIEKAAQTTLARGEFHTLLSWLRRLPESIVQENAQLSILFAEALVIAGELDSVEFYLHNAEQQLNTAAPENYQELLSELLVIRAYLQIYRGNFYTAIDFAQQALDYLPEDNAFIRSILLWVLGFTRYFDQDFDTALKVFAEAIELGKLAGSSLIVLLSMYVSSLLLRIEGRLELAKEILLQGVHFAQADVQSVIGEMSRHPSPGLGGVYQMLGIIAHEQNDLVIAEAYMSRCIEIVEQWGNAEIIVDSYIALAFLRQSQGDFEAAGASMRKAELLVTEGRVSELTVLQVNASHARLGLSSGN